MPGRDSGGTYTSPVSPFITGTVISSTDVNARFAMLESEMTDSLSRSGKGGMLTALKLQDGSAAIPSLQYLEQPGIGLYRAGAYDLRFVMDAATKLKVTSTEVEVPVPLTASGGFTCTTLDASGAAEVASLTVAGTLTSSAGHTATNSNVGGAGLTATGGSGFSVGVQGTGGPTDGWGLYGIGGGTNGIGVWGDGQGTGAAGYFKAGAGASASVSRTAIVADRGDIVFLNTTNPNPSVAHTNALCPMNVPKAWARISFTGGVITVNAGFNIASTAYNGTAIQITLASAFTGTGFGTLACDTDGDAWMYYTAVFSSTVVQVAARDVVGNANVNMTSASGSFTLLCFGAQ